MQITATAVAHQQSTLYSRDLPQSKTMPPNWTEFSKLQASTRLLGVAS